jgi:hypothetical protein
MIDYLEILEGELLANDIRWCKACFIAGSHKRGFAMVKDRVIHYDKKIATRGTLYGALHEVGHIVKNHCVGNRLHRWEEEQEAEQYARDSLRAFGIKVPRREVNQGDAYIARMKRWGDRIKAGRRAARYERDV